MKRAKVELTKHGETKETLTRQLLEAPHPRLRERLWAVLWIADGMTIQEVAQRLNRDRHTVGEWLTAFNVGGVAGLTPQFPGRPGKRLDEKELQELKQTVSQPPRQAGVKQGLWTGPAVRKWIGKQFGKKVSRETVRRYLQQLGLGIKRPQKHLEKADPQKQQEYAAGLQALEQQRCPHRVTVYIDQGQIWQDAWVHQGWFLRGQPAWVESCSPPLGAKRRFYTAVVRPLGQVITPIVDWFNQGTTAQFLDKVRSRLPGYRIDVVWDNAPWHKGP